jgi:uncharacterized protein
MGERYELPLFPLNTVLFPGMMLPLHIFEDRYKEMMQRCLSNSEPFGVVLLKDGRAEGPLGAVHEIGTIAEITQVKRLQGGRMNIVSVGHRRFRLHSLHHENPYLTGIVEDYPLDNIDSMVTQKLAQRIMTRLTSYLKTFRQMGKLNVDFQQFPDDPETLAFLTAIVLPISNEEKQDLLSMPDAEEILREEYELLRHEASILEILVNERQTQQNDSSPFSFN